MACVARVRYCRLLELHLALRTVAWLIGAGHAVGTGVTDLSADDVHRPAAAFALATHLVGDVALVTSEN